MASANTLSSQEVTYPLGRTVHSFGGIWADKFQRDGAADGSALDRMRLPSGEAHAGTSGLGLAQAVAVAARSSSKRSTTYKL